MQKLTTLNKRKAGTSYDLLRKGLVAQSALLRLRAEAERIYPSASKIGAYVHELLNEVEIYLRESTANYELLSEMEMDASIVGELSYRELVRRRDRIIERIAIWESKGNIINFRRKEG